MSHANFGLDCRVADASRAGAGGYLNLEDALHMVRCSGADFACLPLRDDIFFMSCDPQTAAPFISERSAAEQQEITCTLEQLSLRDRVTLADTSSQRLLKLLSSSGVWSRHVVGAVTEVSWTAKAVEQMQLASFLGLPAVIVPKLPTSGSKGEVLSLAAVAREIRAFSALAVNTNVWFLCDARSVSEHETYNQLRDHLGLNEVAVEYDGQDSRRRWRGRAMIDGFGPIKGGKVHVFLSLSGGAEEDEAEFEACWLGESIAAFSTSRLISISNAREMQVQGELPEWGRGTSTSRLSRSSYQIYLMRHRATPTIMYGPIDDMTTAIQSVHDARMIMLAGEVHQGREFFADMEDAVQLPLQPLGHHLPNGVYDTFERDSPKYAAYGEALTAFVADWKRLAWSCGPVKSELHVAVLGAGRGPLVTQVLLAATFHNVKANITAIEKNPEASKYLSLKLRCDPLWQQYKELYGHEVRLLHCDGRVAPARMPNGALCDVVVSELLGSFGDNELSPECLDGFLQSLRSCSATTNDHLVCIPQSYTSLAAPLHSAVLADEVTQAVVTGAHAIAFDEQVGDRHACVAHNLFVVNISKAMLLSQPLEVFTFAHSVSCSLRPVEEEASSQHDQAKSLQFVASCNGRFDGIAGYFHSVLYSPVTKSPEKATTNEIVLSTVPGCRQPRNMFSWFPAFIATPKRFFVRKGDAISLRVERRTRDRHEGGRFVSYEWTVGSSTFGNASPPIIINADGWAAGVRLSDP